MKFNEDIYPIAGLCFDIDKLQKDLNKIYQVVDYKDGAVRGINLTIPNDESIYTKFLDKAKDTYYNYVYQELCSRYKIGRVRILKLRPRTSLSWHRDPEPRIHIPIVTTPGSLVIVDNFATNMPADGSAYFMNTLNYHTAMNGGEEDRIHLVATVLNIN